LKLLREESLMAVADHSRTPRGTLRVGANEATCLYVLPEVFAEYCRLYPPVQINIYRNFSYKITEKLENGSIEVGFLTLPIQSPSLEIQTIFRDKLMLMVTPRNPLAKHKTAAVRDIVKHPVLLPKTGHTRRLMDKLFRPHRDELQVRMELPSIGMIKSFVAADLGVSIISASFARDEVASGSVKLIDLEDVELFRELGLAYRRDRTLSCASTAFIEVLQPVVRLRLRELPMARKQVATPRLKRRSPAKRSRVAEARPRLAQTRNDDTDNGNYDFTEDALSALVVRGCLIARDAVFNVRDFLAEGSRLAFLAIKDCEKELDQIERKIDEQLPGAITRVGEAKARELLACLKFITDLERIGDLAYSAVMQLQGRREKLPVADSRQLIEMASLLC